MELARRGRVWRVRWTRPHWSPRRDPSVQLFTTGPAARSFARRLEAKGPAWIEITYADRSPWRSSRLPDDW